MQYTILAAVFCTLCNFDIKFFGSPYCNRLAFIFFSLYRRGGAFTSISSTTLGRGLNYLLRLKRRTKLKKSNLERATITKDGRNN